MTRAAHVSIEVYKTKWFAKFARKARVSDEALWKAALSAELGQIDADLGHGIIKQRIARKGEGKSGGLRAYLVIRKREQSFYVFGFEKKNQANIDSDEWDALKRIATEIQAYTRSDIATNVRTGALIKIAEVEE